MNEGILTGTDIGCAHGIDIDQHIPTALEVVQNMGFERPIKTAMHLRVFQEIPRGDAGFKFLVGHEKIMFAMNLAGPWCACSAGDGISKIAVLAEGSNERGFASARRGGDNKEDAGACGGEVIQCWQVVRGSCPVQPWHR